MLNIDFVVDSKIDFVVDSKIYFLVDSQIYFVVDSKIVFVSVRPKNKTLKKRMSKSDKNLSSYANYKVAR